MSRLVRCLLVLAALVLGATPAASHGSHPRLDGVHCRTTADVLEAVAGSTPTHAAALPHHLPADAGIDGPQHCLCLLAATLPGPAPAAVARPPGRHFEQVIFPVLSGLPLGPEPPKPRRSV